MNADNPFIAHVTLTKDGLVTEISQSTFLQVMDALRAELDKPLRELGVQSQNHSIMGGVVRVEWVCANAKECEALHPRAAKVFAKHGWTVRSHGWGGPAKTVEGE